MSISEASFENFRQDILLGFQNIDKRFQQLENKINTTDTKVDTFENETRKMFVDIGDYIADITYEQKSLDSRLINIERRFEYFSS